MFKIRSLISSETKREYRGLPIVTHRTPTQLGDRDSESDRKEGICSACRLKNSTVSTYLVGTCLQLEKISLKSHLLHCTIYVAEKYIQSRSKCFNPLVC